MPQKREAGGARGSHVVQTTNQGASGSLLPSPFGLALTSPGGCAPMCPPPSPLEVQVPGWDDLCRSLQSACRRTWAGSKRTLSPQLCTRVHRPAYATRPHVGRLPGAA